MKKQISIMTLLLVLFMFCGVGIGAIETNCEETSTTTSEVCTTTVEPTTIPTTSVETTTSIPTTIPTTVPTTSTPRTTSVRTTSVRPTTTIPTTTIPTTISTTISVVPITISSTTSTECCNTTTIPENPCIENEVWDYFWFGHKVKTVTFSDGDTYVIEDGEELSVCSVLDLFPFLPLKDIFKAQESSPPFTPPFTPPVYPALCYQTYTCMQDFNYATSSVIQVYFFFGSWTKAYYGEEKGFAIQIIWINTESFVWVYNLKKRD